jgi:tRNA nucleotidyltransferase (CCA-adding enzyme)
MHLKPFLSLASVFHKHGFQLWLVGGSVRDYLLALPLLDVDAVTNATPEQMKVFLPQADHRFSQYGLMKLIHEAYTFEITTLRIERDYKDYRHPSSIIFVQTPIEDVVRRDFTMNGLYLDDQNHLLDYVDGQKDIAQKVIRTIGEPYGKFSEDPLRLLRAIRFQLQCGFTMEPNTQQAVRDQIDLLNQLKPQKIESEMKKLFALRHPQTRATLNAFKVPLVYFESMLK